MTGLNGDPVNLLEVQNEIVPLEQAGHGLVLHLHLDVSDPDCTKNRFSLTDIAVVFNLDSSRSRRCHGIDVGQRLQARAGAPNLFLD